MKTVETNISNDNIKTSDIINAENRKYEAWNKEMNIIDNEAIFSSMQYKGGSQERLEYIAKKAELTKIRVFKLVEYYDELKR